MVGISNCGNFASAGWDRAKNGVQHFYRQPKNNWASHPYWIFPGEAYDATPFSFSENHSAIDHFGRTLRKAGFSYYGTEKMYSGVSGLELEAEIFIGVVYYQRLRHMVSDKFQVTRSRFRNWCAAC